MAGNPTCSYVSKTTSTVGNLSKGIQMAKHAPPELKAAIRRYNRDGWSYYALAKIVPHSRTAIATWCDEELRERQNRSSRRWISENKDQHAEASKKWVESNKDHISEYGRAYKKANKEHYKKTRRKYHEEHREERNAASAAYRKANKEKMRQLDYDWVRNNPDKNAAKTARLRAGKACPPWITKEQEEEMLRFYTEAHLKKVETGEDHDVDHIWPLKSRKIEACGLHVPWNLQVLLAGDNRKKSDSIPDS